MKKIIIINASPRIGRNTGTLLGKAGEGAISEGAQTQVFDLYRLENVHGCMSCFACKLAPNEGKCVFEDGLAPVLRAIREADGLIIGTPNYLGDVSAGFRALYERLIFQSLTYRKEAHRYLIIRMPVLFIMTSNAPKEFYTPLGYGKTVKAYQNALNDAVGNTKVMIVGNTLQVNDYSRFNWTMFDPAAKREYHDRMFPEEKKKAFQLGAQMVKEGW